MEPWTREAQEASPSALMAEPMVKIFVSYCHRDAGYLEEDSLLGFLRGLERERVEFWTDRRIATGELWDGAIQRRIAESDIALVLVSQAFLDSEYCQSVEIAAFLERSVEQGLVIVPVILAPCEWRRHPWLASRQCLPGKDQTLEEIFRDRGRRERVFLQLRERLRELVERSRRSPRSDSESLPPSTVQGSVVASAVSGLPWTEDGSVLREIGERRPVTVLACRLDPGLLGQTHAAEDLLERMPPFLDHARRILDRLGGHVVEQDTIGAELIACFGYPNAFEDDPRRAVESGLELLRQLPRFPVPEGLDNVLRIGVHSGEAAVSRQADRSDISLANLPREASALVETAPAGTVLLSEATHRLVRKHYHCQVLPDRRMDGAAETSSQLRAVGAPVRHRVLAKADEGGETPFGPCDEAPVGRRRELELLVDRWELAREGVGQVVVLIGESGLGKSSLLKALKGKLLAEPRTLLECHCSPDHAGTPFYPILELGQRLLANDTEDPRDALLVGSPDRQLSLQAQRLGELLQVPRSESPSTLEQCAVSQGRHLLLGLLQPLLEVARRRPLLLLVEDLEWCDPSTLELLSELVSQVATAPVLMVLTCRPGGEPDWDLPCHLTQLTLGRLARRHVETLVRRLARGLRLPPELMGMIVSRADGVPLFVEELTRWVLDTEDDPQDTLGVPASLQSGLTARLDRLGSAKSVAQLAAALGRDFDEDQLRAVSELDEEILVAELERLVQAGLVHRRGWSPQARYTFTHSLIRSAAHESLFRRQRRAAHRHIAFVLEDRFPEIGRRNPETMAWHYEEAGLRAAALTCWRRAAEKAVREGAVCESILHARRGLRALGELRRTPDLVEHEAALQMALGAALCAAHGYASQEAREAYHQAEALCDQLDDAVRRIPILEALVAYQTLRGRVAAANTRARELLRISEETGEGVEAAHRTLGFSLLLAGELSDCRRHLEAGLGGRPLGEGGVPTESESLGGHPVAASLGDLSWVAWFAGRFSEAVELSDASLAMARSSDNAFCRLYTLLRAAYLQVFLRQAQNARRLAGQLVAEAQHRGSLVFLAMGHVLDGITLALQGRNGEGARKISQGLDGLWATGFGTGQPRNLALLASVLGACGEVDEGLSLLRQAAQKIEHHGACLFEAEVYRIQGEIQALAEQPPTEVRRSLAQALAVARQQGAVALELRALTSLVRVGAAADPEGAWREADRRRLTEVLERFGDEAETADLRDARRLLESTG